MNSMSWSFAPALFAIAIPSPVAIDGFVVYLKTWPVPPVASITASAKTVSIFLFLKIIFAPYSVFFLQLNLSQLCFRGLRY